MLRTVFLGSPAFAVPSLQALAVHPDIEVSLVVTQPDRPAGRGRSVTAPAVKAAALEAGLPLFQPDSLREPAAIQRIRMANPALLIVVAYGEILRREVLELAPHGCINVHPSLLPRYRGATPIPAAILSGDIMTGVSIIRLERRLDAGPLIAQCEHPMQDRDTTGSLSNRLALLAAKLLPQTSLEYVQGRIVPVPQDDAFATYTHEWTSADARIDWSSPAAHIDRMIRASNPWPVAWSNIGGNRFRILEAEVDPSTLPVQSYGFIDASSPIPRVATGEGWLRLMVVQPAGRRPMPADDWLRGHHVMSSKFDTDALHA